MATVDRRTFLRDVAAVTAVAAGSAIAPRSLAAASTALADERSGAPTSTRSPCRFCGVGCGLLIGVEGGRAVSVKGDPRSEVGKGLACAKGYYSIQSLYARDRISRAFIRRNGELTPAPIGEALDLVAKRLRETVQSHGKDSVALYGSAQWSITDAYIASKLFKGGLGTNNVDTSTRLHSAAATAGLQTTFGLDGSVGCYDDIDYADVFVLWDINLAETDPVLFSRILDRRRLDPAVRIVDLATRTTRTSHACDHALLFAPRSGLAIANAIAHEIVARKWVHRAFVDRNVAFRRGKTDIGHGLGDEALIQDDALPATWDEYVEFLSKNAPDLAQRVSGLPADKIRWLASLYGDRTRKVMTIWGANATQHTRGTWMNNALYNIHLLTGKIASPGNSALALTGQPSGGCSVHDAGARAETLPAGLASNESDRKRAASIWNVPVERIDPRPGRTALAMFRALDRGDVRFLWIQATNPMVSLPNLDRYRRAALKDDRFVVVSEAYPTPTSDIADVVLPAAMWLERDAVFGNSERRVQLASQAVSPPGEAMSDGWQMIEVAKRLGLSKLFPWERQDHAAGVWEEYRRFHEDSRSALPTMSSLRARAGAIWPHPTDTDTKWRYNSAHDPAANRARGSFDFYGHSDSRAWIWLRPYVPPVESTSREYPLLLSAGPVLEHWGGGAMTQRIPTLHRAVPSAYLELHRDDAKRFGIADGDRVRVVSARGSLAILARVDYRSQPPRGQVFVPSFDESLPVRRLMLDACCPISGQLDTGPCAVRLERLPSAGAS